MKREDVLTALEEISDKHIIEAEKTPKNKAKTFLRIAVAAALVIVIGVNVLSAPARIVAKAVAEPSKARILENPDYDDYEDREEWLSDLAKVEYEHLVRRAAVSEARSGLRSFFEEGNNQFLQTEKNENKLWSPVNAYIGMAMATELTEGKTRQQILELLGAKDMDTLRKQVSAVWESTYQDNSNEICVLANSLWLERGLQYNHEAMDALAYHYYASVYQGNLGSDEVNKDIA